MKNIFKIVTLFALIVLSNSCKNEKSLQAYLVESQDKEGFVTLDIPTSFLQLKSEDVSADVKQTLESIKKVNIVALPIKSNETAYQKEKGILKNILSENKDYKNLMTMKFKDMHVSLYYTGSTSSIDELIAFGYGEKQGVGVARLLGDDMNPAKIIEMMKNVKVDGDDFNLSQLNAIFKSKK